jgi:hypothetical protein
MSIPSMKTSVLLHLDSLNRRWIRRSPVAISKRQERKWYKGKFLIMGFGFFSHFAFFIPPKGHSKEPEALVLTIIIPERDIVLF